MTALSRLPYRLPLQPGDAAPARSTDFLPDARRYAMHRLRPGELCHKQRLPSGLKVPQSVLVSADEVIE